MQNGEMTAQLAAGITQYIETIESLEYQARAEAHRREAVKFFAEGNMSGLDRQLTKPNGPSRTSTACHAISR